MANIVELDLVAPTIGDGLFLAPNADLLADGRVGDRGNIWFGAVVRGDHLTSSSAPPLHVTYS